VTVESIPEDRRVLRTIEELRDAIELDDIRYVDISATRTADIGEDAADVEPQLTLGPSLSKSGKRLRVHVTGRLTSRVSELCVSVDAIYRFDEPVRFEDEKVVVEFMGNSTIVSVAPHIREAFQSLSLRLRAPVPMIGLIKPAVLEPIDPNDTSVEIDD
jgi:hypothetical protein